MSATPELLPPNSTPLEVQTEAAAAARLAGLAVFIRDLWNPLTCPAAWLPALAWALSVDVWRSQWPEGTKRAVVAASPRVHRLKGTVGAVKAALGAVAGTLPVRLIEWFQPGGSGIPYTAIAEIELHGDDTVDGSLTRDLVQAVEASRNVRSRVLVRLSVAFEAGLAVAAHLGRPMTTVRLGGVGEYRPHFDSPIVAASLLGRPIVSVSIEGSAL